MSGRTRSTDVTNESESTMTIDVGESSAGSVASRLWNLALTPRPQPPLLQLQNLQG